MSETTLSNVTSSEHFNRAAAALKAAERDAHAAIDSAVDGLAVGIEIVVNDGRDSRKPQQAHRPVAPLSVADDEVVFLLGISPDGDRLQEAVCLDGFGQLNDGGFVKGFADIVGIWLDARDG